METQRLTIDAGGSPMQAFFAKPTDDGKKHPAIIVLEGVYGFDEEMLRVTQLVTTAGFVGLAINYFHRTHPELAEPYTAEGRARGTAATAGVRLADLRTDIEAARAWLAARPEVDQHKIGAWGFGFGGAAAFVAACTPGISAAVAFYGQAIARPLPSGDPAPLDDTAHLHAPLLLVFGGRDEMITQAEIETIGSHLKAAGKTYDLQVYPTVGHSFFREYRNSGHAFEIADAWDRTQAFLKRAVA